MCQIQERLQILYRAEEGDSFMEGRKRCNQAEINTSIDSGVVNVRIGGATDIYTHRAEGVEDFEYLIPNPEPVSKVLHGARENESLKITS